MTFLEFVRMNPVEAEYRATGEWYTVVPCPEVPQRQYYPSMHVMLVPFDPSSKIQVWLDNEFHKYYRAFSRGRLYKLGSDGHMVEVPTFIKVGPVA